MVAWQAAARMFQEGALFAAGVIAAEEMPASRRGTAQGLLGTVNSLGSGLGAFLFGVLDYLPFGWRGLCLVSAIPIGFLPLLRTTVPESRRWLARTHPGLHLPPAGYRGRTLLALAVVLLAMSYDVAGFAFATYVPVERYGWSSATTSAMLIVAGALGLPGWWVGGRLADRHGRRGAGAVFLVGLTVAEVAFFSGGPTMLWPGFAGMVFCQGAKVTVLRAWVTELFPTSFRGAAAGWMAASGTLGGMAGLALAGALERPLGGICPAISLVAMAGVVAAAIAYVALPETVGIELEMTAPEPG
jgi:MFS family permease